MKLTEGWKIFIAGVLVTLFIFIPVQEWIWPKIEEKWLFPEQSKPNLYVFLYYA